MKYHGKITQILFLLIFPIALIGFFSCKGKKIIEEEELDKFISNTTSEFDSKRNLIYYKQARNYDIHAEIDIPMEYKNNSMCYNFTCLLSFYNYGDNIKLYKSIQDDFFFNLNSDINYFCVVENENINIKSREHNNKYGEWAMVNLNVDGVVIYNCFMTPLAFKEYSKGDHHSNYIYIQFRNQYSYRNIIFYGDLNTTSLISNFPNLINKKGGHFHKITSDDIYWYNSMN